MGNGAKKQMKQERNTKKLKEGKSQNKINESAKNIVCKTCFQAMLCTSREKALSEHAENKHNKTLKECFPDWAPPS